MLKNLELLTIKRSKNETLTHYLERTAHFLKERWGIRKYNRLLNSALKELKLNQKRRLHAIDRISGNEHQYVKAFLIMLKRAKT